MLTRRFLFVMTLAALSIGGYLFSSWYTFRIGFPLDDAWIHQTYARNLAFHGEWAFLPGQLSGGSTAPLWSGLLALGYYLPNAPYLWVYLLGFVTLVAIAITGYFGFQVLWPPANRTWALIAGVVLVLEWHLVWSAASGMETSLFSLLVLVVVILLAANWHGWGVLGILIGITIWVRPDGATLILPTALLIAIAHTPSHQRFGSAVRFSLGLVITTGPYLIFNKFITGNWLPNTFFAKQAEYAVELAAPLLSRLVEQAILPLVGVGICLLPGFVYFFWRAIRDRQWAYLAGPVWALGYLSLYALRLPVTYQHGRYVIPMMPVYFLWGMAGFAQLIQLQSPIFWKRVLSRVWFVVTAIVLIMFWILGARAYGRDVAIIESEMVDVARWIERNTEPNALVAAHDIGALGYFGERKLVDLAGLVSPQVIPFIRDETRLAQYLDEQNATYLVTFPGWYPYLVNLAVPVYKSGGRFSPQQGGENLVIYRWSGRP